MPQLGNRHFPYSKAGYAAYRKARKRKPSKKGYSNEAITMARRNLA